MAFRPKPTPLRVTAKPAAVDMLGPFAINLSGSEGGADRLPTLSLSAVIGRSTFAIDRKNYLEGEIDLAASITAGENKARIENLTIRQGRSNYVLFGPVGPRPVAAGEPPAYRFELASDNSVSAPDGSTEPALTFAARVAATYDPGCQASGCVQHRNPYQQRRAARRGLLSISCRASRQA